jgi:hypothetical protein
MKWESWNYPFNVLVDYVIRQLYYSRSDCTDFISKGYSEFDANIVFNFPKRQKSLGAVPECPFRQ